MTGQELDALISGMAPVVKEYVAASFDTLAARLKALEGRELVPGPSGPVGERGEPGPAGERGLDGIGLAGRDGTDGPVGPQGEPGPAGATGERGPEGPIGVPGRDGRDGAPGVQGAKGLDGQNGADGQHGKDGAGFDDWSVIHDGERGFTFRCGSGERVKEFTFTIPCMIYREVFVDGKRYEPGDVVTWGGSMWCAKEATAAKPGTSREWQLAVKAGREGKQGPEGKRGDIGPRGEKGETVAKW